MAMVVSPEVAKLFQVLTGEEWPDANEDQLRALAAEWTAAAQTLAELGPGLRSAVQAIRSEFAGEAAQAFVQRMAPFVEGEDLISTAAELFNGLAKTLTDLALDVEYMKIVTIASLVALIAEIAWATAMAPFTGGATMAWLAARMAVVRFMMQTLLRRVLMQVLSTAVFSIAFQLLIDVVAQVSQFAMGTRTEWNTDYTKNAAGVGAMGAALALPIGGLGKLFGSGLNSALNAAFAKQFGKDWAKNGARVLSNISTESFHEVMTEALYKYATEGEFEMNPYAATAGAASGASSAGGKALGDKLASAMKNRPGGNGDRSGGNATNTGGSGDNRDISGGDNAGSIPPTSPSTETPGAGGQNPPVVQAQTNGGNQPPNVVTGNSGGTNQTTGSSGQQEAPTSGTGNVPPAQSTDRSGPQGPPNQSSSRQDLPGGSQSPSQSSGSTQGTSGQQNTTAPGTGQAVETPGAQGNPPQGSTSTSGQQNTTTPGTGQGNTPGATNGQNPPVVQNQPPPVQHDSTGSQQTSGSTVEQPSHSTSQNTSGNQVDPTGDQQQTASDPADQTVSNPADQTASNPAEQTASDSADQTASQTNPNPVEAPPQVSDQTSTAPSDVHTGQQTPGTTNDVDLTGTTPDPNRGLSGTQQDGAQLPPPAGIEPPPVQQQDGRTTSDVPQPEAKTPDHESSTETTTIPVRQDDPNRQPNTTAPPQVNPPPVVEQTGVQQTPDEQVQSSQDDPPPVQQTSNPVQQSQNSGQQTPPSVQQTPTTVQQTSDPVQQQPPSPGQQTPPAQQNAGQQTSNPTQQQTPPPAQQQNSGQQTPPLVQSTQNPGQTSGSSTTPGTTTAGSSTTLPSTRSTTQRAGQDSKAPKTGSTPKTSSSTTAPGMTPNREDSSSKLSPQQVAASIGLPEAEATSSRTAPESYEMSTLSTGRTDNSRQNPNIAVQPTEQNNSDQQSDQNHGQDTTPTDVRQNNDDQQNTGLEDDTRSNDSRQDDRFADLVAEATRNARDTTATRQTIESDLGKINAAGAKARRDLGAIQRSTRVAHGAVIATREAFGPDPQRTAQAQQRFDVADQNRIDRAAALTQARDRHADAVQRLDDARDQLGGARTLEADPNAIRKAEDGVRGSKESSDLLGERLKTADQAHSQAAAAAANAKQDLDRAKATEESANAANTAYDKASAARDTATSAINTIADGNTNAQDALNTVDNAANRSTQALNDLNDAVNNANAAKTAADDLTAQANQANEGRTTLEDQRNAVDRDLGDLYLSRPENDQQRVDRDTRAEALKNELADLDGRIEDARNNAENLTTRAQDAQQQHNDAIDRVENIRTEIDALREQARAAETAAADARQNAENAAEQSAKAKKDATEAAAQGQYEQGLTELSFLPHESELQFERLGPRDGLIDALTDLTGADRNQVATEIGALSDAGLVAAIGNGTIQVAGTDIAVSPDLYRPDDTRAAPPNQQPSTKSTEHSDESGRPQSESTSTSIPIRIPLLFISPLDLTGTVVRPMVYVGGAVKRSQRFDSGLTFTDNSGNSRGYVPTRMELGLSVPGRQLTTSIDAGLRTPGITRGDGITAPLPDADFTGVKPVLASIPDPLGNVLGNSRDASAGLTNQLFAGNGNPAHTTIGDKPVTIVPVGDAQVTYVGTTSVDSTSAVSLGRSWQTSKGSDASVGGGPYVGKTEFYVGGFVDFSSGLTDGSTPGTDDSVTQISGDHQLVYEISRDMRVGDGHTDPADGQPQSTVRTQLQVPVWQARDLGLPLPPHLAEPSTPTPNADQPYRFGRDDIKFVDRDQVSGFVTGEVRDTPNGLSDKGRDAINDKFRSPEVAKNTIHDAMHGGAHASWVKGGRTHFVDIYAIPAVPESTMPSGQQEVTTEVKHSDKFQRGYKSSRTARIGVGGAFRPKGTDSPNPDAPKATPENGLPNPYQGGPTQTYAGPRVALAVNWDSGISNKSGYTSKDGRAAKYGGDMRDYEGPLDFVVVHGSTKNPNWAQHFFLGDRMLFGPKAGARYDGPSKAEVEQALAGGDVTNPNIHRGRVDDAIRVSTAADKLNWGTKPLPASTTQSGTYLGPPPALPSKPVTSELFGDYTNVENVRITPNNTEAVDLALAKRIEQVPDAAQPDGTTIRKPPKGSGNWPAWAEKTFTDTRNGANGAQQSTDYVYKSSELTRPGTTGGDAVRDFQGKVGSFGTATQGLGDLASSTGTMFREGRAQDYNGTLNGEATYHSPRLVDVRAESTLKRNQAGEQVAGSTKSWGLGGELEIIGNVMPRRHGQVGSMLGGLLSGGGKYGRSHALDLTSGGRQETEYTGPTALITLDVRYRYWADMALRSVVSSGNFGDADAPGPRPDEVNVDEPNGVQVEVPVNQAIAMFEALDLPVPPELSAMRPSAKEQISNPSHTVLTGPGEYASYSDTSVTDARLTGDDPMGEVRDRLTDIGVKDAEHQREVLDQVNAMLNTSAGYQWLQDPLAGQPGLISVPHPGSAVEDVVDIRVKAKQVTGPLALSQTDGTAPDKLYLANYVTTSHQDKNSTSWSVNGAINAGVRKAETPSVPPGQPDENGQVQEAPPNPGTSSGAFTPQVFGAGKSWKTEDVLPGSGSEKMTTRVDNDKVGRDTRLVDYELEITRRRQPMPGIDTLGAGIPKHVVNLDKGVGDAPIHLSGKVDLVSPSSDASPALRKPAQQPEIQVLDGPRQQRPSGFTPDDAFRIESIGADTAKAVHDAVYAQLSSKLPNGNLTADQIAAATQTPSEFTRPGSNSEYVAHSMTKGSSLHNASNTMFTGGDYQAGNTLGTKHPLYDSLFDLKLSGDVRPENLTFVAALPKDTTMNLTREREITTADGKTKTVTTSLGPSVSSYGSQTHQATGPSPTYVIVLPPASGTVGNDETNAQSSKDGETTGVKHQGRSYLFRADTADIYSDAHVHGSNWTHQPITAIKDLFSGHGHPQDSSVKITSHDDLHVRVWENTALDKGLITLHDVWNHASKLPGDQATYGLTGNTRGATIHPPGQTNPAAGQPAPNASTGRNLHVAPGVTLDNVKDFIGKLPKDMRPTTYTVDPGLNFGNSEVQEAVAGLPEPPKPETTEPETTSEVQVDRNTTGTPVTQTTEIPVTSEVPVDQEATPVVTETPVTTDTRATEVPATEVPLPETPVTETPPVTQNPVSTENPAATETPDGSTTARSTPPAFTPPHTDAIGSPSLVAASELFAKVPPGTRFAAPESFADLISKGPGQGNTPVHAALAFHSTYHGSPQISDGALEPGQGGMTGAADKLGVPPTPVGRGADGLADVIDRVTRGGHGSDALLFAFQPDGQANAWNVVNHNGSVSVVDAFSGTIMPATPDLLTGAGELFAIPLDPEGNFISDGIVLPGQQGAISYQQAHQLYAQLAADTFEHPVHGTVTMPTGHPEDGCYIRAHLWASKLQEWGVDVRKVFMSRGEQGLHTMSANAYGATADHPRAINWSYHVAPLVSVDMGNGFPPVEMVLDPAMSYDFAGAVGADRAVPYQGVVPVRQWINDAGIFGGFAEADLYEPRQWQGNEGPVGPDEVRVRITDAHVVGPPWLVQAPGSFQQANQFVQPFLDSAYDFTVEVGHRNDFKAWHESLPPHARAAFNQLDAKFGNGALKDFHDWFRGMNHTDRARLADWFAGPGATTQDIVPPWANRVQTARDQLFALTEEQRMDPNMNAVILLFAYQGTLPSALYDEMIDMIAYRHHVDGYDSAEQLTRDLIAEYSASVRSTQYTDAVAGPVEQHDTSGTSSEPVVNDPPTESRQRSRDEFEEDGPVTTYEPSHQRPIPERLVPPAQGDTDQLLAAVPPGTRFADPASFAELINGSRSDQGRDVNCVDAALAFHETYHGNPRVAGIASSGVPQSAGTAAAEGLGYAPELFGQGPSGLAEVIDRVTRAGHGADALVIGFPRSGGGHAWNVVNHHGEVSIVDAQAGTIRPATTNGFSWLDRVYAIPLDADGNYVEDAVPAPEPPVNADAYATAEYERAQLAHEMRRAAAAGEEIPVPGTNGRLVPSLGGLRLVGAAITAELAADLASLTNRDLIALVIGPDAEYPELEDEPIPGLEELKFPPRGRPERVGATES
ncbi:toxin glutamine deamidase domain-containing protein [Saccharopolyspora sp. NPDC002376]